LHSFDVEDSFAGTKFQPLLWLANPAAHLPLLLLLLLLLLLGLSKVGGELSIGIFATRDITAGMTLLMVCSTMRLRQGSCLGSCTLVWCLVCCSAPSS